jgi:protein-disulfide isomerase
LPDQPDRPDRTSQPRRNALVVAVVAAAVAVAMAVYPTLTGTEATDRVAGAPPTSADPGREEISQALMALARREPGDPFALCDPDAPVVMVAYSDYQCPFCGSYARDTEPLLVERYVNSGVLRIEWRDFPYLGAESDLAARAGRAAAQQGRFWQFHSAMFTEQPPPNSGRIDEGFLLARADAAGLDTERFRADLGSPQVIEAVARDFQEGQTIGVTGTPAFIVNDQPVIGAQPVEVFVQVIEQAADAAA